MHTKGKLKYLRSKKKHKDDLFLYTDAHNLPDGFIGKLYGFGIHDETANAQRLVKCWNEYDKEVERANLAEAALVKFEHLAAEEIAGFNALKAKADVCDELVKALKKYARHLPACECMWKTLQSRKCTCGFEQALAKFERIE